MDFELPEELAEVQKLAHDFADKEIAPGAAQDDREHRFRKNLVGKMGELGFYGCLIPEEFGAQRSGVPRPHASGESIGLFAITEPDAGSDVAAMKTTAKRDGQHYLLNGTKIWITNATVADAGVIFACSDRSQKHRGLSAFYADLNQPGVTAAISTSWARMPPRPAS
jgi:glutaryl-CoA dehydrogenase (non-decarboxylating)